MSQGFIIKLLLIAYIKTEHSIQSCSLYKICLRSLEIFLFSWILIIIIEFMQEFIFDYFVQFYFVQWSCWYKVHTPRLIQKKGQKFMVLKDETVLPFEVGIDMHPSFEFFQACRIFYSRAVVGLRPSNWKDFLIWTHDSPL